jgi:hypothetical protein
MGWKPLVDKETGIQRLWEWAAANRSLFEELEVERSSAA